jgi:hypothetical protein
MNTKLENIFIHFVLCFHVPELCASTEGKIETLFVHFIRAYGLCYRHVTYM